MIKNKRIVYEIDEVRKVLDFMKADKNIISIQEDGDYSVITTDSLVLLKERTNVFLSDFQIITIGTNNYQVFDVNNKNKTFKIFASNLTATKWHLAINYKFGSLSEINNMLNVESKDVEKNMIRFPMVWLFANEKREHNNLDFDFTTTLKLSFVNISNLNWKVEDRLNENIKKAIMPLVDLFLRTITSVHFADVFTYKYEELSFNEYIRYFYGSADKSASLLSTITDAVELEINNLTFENQF